MLAKQMLATEEQNQLLLWHIRSSLFGIVICLHCDIYQHSCQNGSTLLPAGVAASEALGSGSLICTSSVALPADVKF